MRSPGKHTDGARHSPHSQETASYRHPAHRNHQTITESNESKLSGYGIPGPGAPAAADIALSTAPEEIEVADANGTVTLKMDVASLEKPYGVCASGCSDWWVVDQRLGRGGQLLRDTAHRHSDGPPAERAHRIEQLASDMGNGIYTPLYFEWS